MLDIDGSHGEGGGQILRTAISLSSFSQKPVRIINIRANRPNPGLNYQHMAAIKSVAELCKADVKGLTKGSRELEFHPNEILGGKFHFDILTAGSTTLVLQACVLPSLFASEMTEFTITGGTDVKWAPPIDYFRFVFAPLLHNMGAHVNVVMGRRGHYPKGGGEITARIKPVEKLMPLIHEQRGALKTIRGIAHVSNLPNNITKRMKHSVLLKLVGIKDLHISEEHYPQDKDPAPGVGTGIVLWANYENTVLGANGLGEKGVPAERIAQNAVEDLLKEMNSKATLDVHAADQLLPYMALAKGESMFCARELSNHAKTNIWLIEKFLDVKFEVKEKDGLKEARVRGVG
ncbi:MAG: RNA 3'-terminal phosphate cyclase [Methanomassiliicoccales archaeon]|nr:MAG: RNA 3'-terminal phosphate cyclase [Methanomassiliicoccales archaeon]